MFSRKQLRLRKTSLKSKIKAWVDTVLIFYAIWNACKRKLFILRYYTGEKNEFLNNFCFQCYIFKKQDYCLNRKNEILYKFGVLKTNCVSESNFDFRKQLLVLVSRFWKSKKKALSQFVMLRKEDCSFRSETLAKNECLLTMLAYSTIPKTISISHNNYRVLVYYVVY